MSKDKQNQRIIEEKFGKEKGGVFAEILSQEELEEHLKEENVKYRIRTLTPIITLWAFIYQIWTGESCRKTTEAIVAFLIANKTGISSLTESAYCQAKGRLKESFLKRLVLTTGKELNISVDEQHLWHGRNVKLMDASGDLMADTQKNQEKYPQYYNCKPGCGYPIVRFAVLFCLVTGAVLQMYYCPKEISERTLFRSFYKHLYVGDIVLGDRGCCSFADISMLIDMDVDCVFRLYHRKKTDFTKGKIIVHRDHIVEWNKPNRPKTSAWPKEEYKKFPSTIQVREIEYEVCQPGFRSEKVILVTTLLDAELYTKEDLADLYFLRWQAEINLRHIKTTLKMDFIDAKSPQMFQNSLWVYFLVYNLNRTVMWRAAIKNNVNPCRISFKGTLDRIDVFNTQIVKEQDPYIRNLLYQTLFWNISQDLLPVRINRRRIFARCVKPKKNFPRISRSREEHRKHVLGEQLTA